MNKKRIALLFIPVMLFLALLWGNSATIVKASGATLSGRVVDENGNGIGGAQILSHEGSSTYPTTLSDSSGYFTLHGVLPGSNHLQASLSGSNRAYAHYWGFLVSEGGNYSGVNFTLRPGGGTISGRVVDGSGKGVPGAQINVFEQTAQGFNNGAWAATTTDGNGYFATSATNAPGPGLPTGNYTILVNKTGMPNVLLQNVPVTAGSATADIVISMLTGNGVISGRVTDLGSGAGVSGAEIYVDNGVVQVSVFSDSNGYYNAGNLPSGGYHVVVSKAEFASAHRYGVLVGDGSTTSGVDFALSRQKGQISGRVTNAQGQPIIGANVMADSDQGNGFGSTTTNGNGEYTLTNMAPMLYYVHAEAPGYAALIQMAQVNDGATTSGINFALGAPGGGISGRVTKDGQPAPMASIIANSSEGSTQLYYRSAVTDADGNYSLPNLPSGQYDVHVSDVPGYTNQVRYQVQVSGGVVGGINFNLVRGSATVAGRVTGANGNPVAGATIQLFEQRNPGSWGRAVSDSNGYYLMEGLTPGMYTLYADHFDYPQVMMTDVAVPSEQVDVVMGSSRALRSTPPDTGVMIERDGSAMTSLRINVTSGSKTTWTATTTVDWLLLGESGNNHKASGQTGENLTLRFDSRNVGYGTHVTNVELTAPDASPITIQVTMIKVRSLTNLYFPLAGK